MEILQLPTTKCQAPCYKPYEQSETRAKRIHKWQDRWSDNIFIENFTRYIQ